MWNDQNHAQQILSFQNFANIIIFPIHSLLKHLLRIYSFPCCAKSCSILYSCEESHNYKAERDKCHKKWINYTHTHNWDSEDVIMSYTPFHQKTLQRHLSDFFHKNTTTIFWLVYTLYEDSHSYLSSCV